MKRVLVWLALAATAHAEGRPKYHGTIDGSLLGAPATLDPVFAQSHAEVTLVHLVFDTLYCVEADGIAQPHLAIALPAIDGKVARIAIRHGVKFHDGSEMTARDVAASLDRASRTGNKWALAALASVRADGDIVELHLKGQVSDLAMLLSLPQTAITKGGKPPGDRPVGTGPFALQALDGGKVTLDKFEAHFAGRPYLNQLALHWYDTDDGEARRFETGDTQLSERHQTSFGGSQPVYKADDVEGPAALLIYVGFGRAHANVTGDKGFRRAVDLAVARGSLGLIKSDERVVPTKLPVPVEAGAPGVDSAGKAEDLEGARAALDDAIKRVPDISKLGTLEILVEKTRPDDTKFGRHVVEQLDLLGIHAQVTPVSAKELRDRTSSGKYDLVIDQIAEPVTAASAWWGAAFAAGGDDWAEKQLASGSIGMTAAQKAFADRLPIIPLVFRSVHVWHRSDIRGLGLDATGRIGFADLFIAGDPVKTKKGK